jgi:hypothetical protein
LRPEWRVLNNVIRLATASYHLMHVSQLSNFGSSPAELISCRR